MNYIDKPSYILHTTDTLRQYFRLNPEGDNKLSPFSTKSLASHVAKLVSAISYSSC